jgi:K+-transporting ATPase ATPase C chain
MRAQLGAALRAIAVFTVLLGLAYPLAVTGIAQLAFGDQADGSLVERDGRVVGSRLIGQAFDGDEWFHSRPSAAGDGYDAMASAASNLGPTNEVLLDAVAERAVRYRATNGLAADQPVPVDAVTSSGSGLDPHISVANARLQAARVAHARGLAVQDVLALIDEHTDERALGFLGEAGVNVLELNLAVDAAE